MTESPNIAVAVQGRPDQAALQLGIDRGYFSKQGLNITTVQIDSGAQMVPSLSMNQVQVGNGAPSAALFNALNRGIDIRIVADYAHVGNEKDTTLALLVRKDLMGSGAVKKAGDLKGQPVALGTLRGTVTDMLWDGILRKEGDGLSPTDFETLYMPFPDILAAFGSGRIAAGTLTEPLATLAITQGVAEVLYPAGAIIPGAHLSVLQYSPAFAREQPTAATKFMVAYLQGVRDYYDAFHLQKNRDEAINLLVKSLSLKDPAVWAKAAPEFIDLNGRVSTDDLVNQAKFYLAQGTIEGTIPEISRYVDNQFVDGALKVIGPR